MARALKRVNLMLDEALVLRLKKESQRRRLSMSELVRIVLAEGLGLRRRRGGAVERLRRLRSKIKSMPDTAPEVRQSRDQGW